MNKEILNAVARFEKQFKILLVVFAIVVIGLLVGASLGVWKVSLILLLICGLLSLMYLRIRYVMKRNIAQVNDDRYSHDVRMKRKAADIAWCCLMLMTIMLMVFVYIVNNFS